MRIAVDQDEVLCQWIARILEWYNQDKRRDAEQMGLRWDDVSVGDITSWDVTMNLGHGSEQYIRSYMRASQFYQDLDPVAGAVDGMQSLIAAGHDTLVVTHVPKCAGMAYEGKKEWLRRNIPEFDLKNLISCSRKYLISADLLFDDGLHNIVPFWESGRVAVVLDRPHNKLPPDQENLMLATNRFFRVETWGEFVDLVRILERMNVCGE